MSNAPSVQTNKIEAALIGNDLSRLSDSERLSYYKQVCDSVGLNYLTNPFLYIILNGKLRLYATKDAAEQLRKIHRVSIQIVSKEIIGDAYVVHVKGKDKDGTEDEATGIVPISDIKGEALANAMLKAETKAKRRVTLSICGLGMLDENELSSIAKEDIKQVHNPQIANPLKEVTAPADIPEVFNDEDLGEYVCQVGKKYRGVKLKDIDMFELDNYLKWLKDSAEKSGKSLGGFQEFYDNAIAYLCSLESNNETID